MNRGDNLVDIKQRQTLIMTGFIGLAGAILVGAGEFLLHYDSLARFSEASYEFMQATPDKQQTIGHFFGVLSAPLYLVGCWHIYLMLKPANQKLAFVAFILSSYGFIMGVIWISSRASIGAIIHSDIAGATAENLIQLYQLRYESLLTIIRITTVLLSTIYIGLVLTGKTYYEKSQAILNPILLLLLNFVIYLLNPAVGKYMMPIALNIGFGLFFLMSLVQAKYIN
jgi:uncharacterized protein DUF6796